MSRAVEQKLEQFARSSQGPMSAAVRRRGINGPVGRGLDQSLLMFAEPAMAVVTDPVAVHL